MSAQDNYVKVRLPVPADMDVDADFESVWAEPLGGGVFQLHNIPFMAEGFAPDDRITASFDNGIWTATGIEQASGVSVLVCVCNDEAIASELLREVATVTERYEFGFDKEMLAIAVEGADRLRKLRRIMDAKERAGLLEYGELTVR